MQAEGEAAYADVQYAQTTPSHGGDRHSQQSGGGAAGSIGTPVTAARLSAAHIATTPPHAAAAAASASATAASTPAGSALTPQSVEAAHTLLTQAETPVSAAAQLSAHLGMSPNALTPGVAQAVAEAGEAMAAAASQQGQQDAAANLDKIKAKLALLKQHIQAKTKRMSGEKRQQIEAQIEKLEKSLAYVEKQRVSHHQSGLRT